MVDTIKFSQFVNGGDLSNDTNIVGLDASLEVNTIFNVPWTYLAEGSTGDRPIPAPAMYYRQRFNTTLEVYEYYDPTIPIWTQLSGSGTGTVNPGIANDIAFYASSGTSVSPIASANNAVLITSSLGVPSFSTTLPIGISIPSAIITASTAELLSGSVVATPIAGIDITNKTYVDSLVGGAVTSITGTLNQVFASSPTGAITLSLPQDIATGSTPTFAGLTLTSIPLTVSSGGTGAVTASGARTNLGLGTIATQNANAIAITGGTAAIASGSVTATPTSGIDIANKDYVDAVARGLNIQGSCVAGSTVALTVTYDDGVSGVGATLTNAGVQDAISLDGVSPTVGQRVVIKNQASTFQNGIYTTTTVGTKRCKRRNDLPT